MQERSNWRKDHPHGFVARPAVKDGVMDLLTWECKIPGKKGTKWEGGLFPVTLKFTENYPASAPQAHFPAGFFHPNVYPSGKVCLSIINDSKGWRPSTTVRTILQGIQTLLDEPNNGDAAQELAYRIFRNDQRSYIVRVKQEVAKYSDGTGGGPAPTGGGGGDDPIVL